MTDEERDAQRKQFKEALDRKKARVTDGMTAGPDTAGRTMQGGPERGRKRQFRRKSGG